MPKPKTNLCEIDRRETAMHFVCSGFPVDRQPTCAYYHRGRDVLLPKKCVSFKETSFCVNPVAQNSAFHVFDTECTVDSFGRANAKAKD